MKKEELKSAGAIYIVKYPEYLDRDCSLDNVDELYFVETTVREIKKSNNHDILIVHAIDEESCIEFDVKNAPYTLILDGEYYVKEEDNYIKHYNTVTRFIECWFTNKDKAVEFFCPLLDKCSSEIDDKIAQLNADKEKLNKLKNAILNK